MTNLLDAQTEVHVQLGNGAPAFIPTAIGQHYIDIANKRVYQSTGVNSVEDWGDALATLDDLAKLDFTVTKADVGLDKVENYGVASKAEAEGGEINDAYMTPLRVTELLNALYKPTLDAFMARTDNPHQVTAAQVGALTAVQTEALLAEKLNSGDLAGLLQVFWSEKVGGAPETLDTIDEIAAALQNNPEVIEALQALVEGNRLTIVEAMDAIAALQALVGESTAFLTAESDLGVNPVALTGDEGAARDLKTILEGMVAKDAAQDQALTDARESLQTQIGTKADKVTTEAALSGLQTAVEGLGTQISDNEQASTDAIQAVQDAVVTEKGEREAADLVLDQKVDAAVLALEENKVGRTDNIDTNTVTEGEGEEAVQVALSTLIAQLKAGIAQAGDASALDALQQAFNAFVAAKATTAEVIAGLDDAKYTTAMAVKGAIDQAVNDLVGSAPEVLNTIQELATALQNNPDVIQGLVDQIAAKETPEGAQAKADAAVVSSNSYTDSKIAEAATASETYTDNSFQAFIDECNRLAAEIEGFILKGSMTIAGPNDTGFRGYMDNTWGPGEGYLAEYGSAQGSFTIESNVLGGQVRRIANNGSDRVYIHLTTVPAANAAMDLTEIKVGGVAYRIDVKNWVETAGHMVIQGVGVAGSFPTSGVVAVTIS